MAAVGPSPTPTKLPTKLSTKLSTKLLPLAPSPPPQKPLKGDDAECSLLRSLAALLWLAGVLTLANGDTFAGYWSQGVINGPGMLTLHAESPWNVPDL